MPRAHIDQAHHSFSWNNLGDIKTGRGALGESMPVLAYRMLEFSMNAILYTEYGPQRANTLFRKAGHLAGMEFAENALDLELPPDAFIEHLSKKLLELKIGRLVVEEFEPDSGDITITVADDLDCSGLTPTNEVVCNYDEGFLAGVLEVYTGHHYLVREIDCWASGDTLCRFKGQVTEESEYELA